MAENTRPAYTTDGRSPASPVTVYNPRDAAALELAGYPLRSVVIHDKPYDRIAAGTAVFYFDATAWDALKRFRAAIKTVRAEEARARQAQQT